MKISLINNGFEITQNEKQLLVHTTENPAIFVGVGQEKMEIYRGNFDIHDYIEERIPLRFAKITDNIVEFSCGKDSPVQITMKITHQNNSDALLSFESQNQHLNRFWIRLTATQNERVWGCGEQMSYLNMRGRHFPLWTSEPGVGRDKTTEITFISDKYNKEG